MFNNKKLWLVSRLVRTFGTSSVACANHYDVLGLTPKATQGDIKSAYYKLSMIHHPDKTGDAESAKKFRAITEAYKVLGNLKLKKMYDKGLLVGRENRSRMDYQPEPEPTDPTLRFYKSRSIRNVTPTMDGQQPIYDFDAWAKNHYGDLFEKSQQEKKMSSIKRQKKEDLANATRHESYMYLFFITIATFVFFVINGKADYDLDKVSNKQKDINTDIKGNK